VIGENFQLKIEALVSLPCFHFSLYQLPNPAQVSKTLFNMAASTVEEDVGRSSNDNGKGNGLLLYHHHYSFYSQKVYMNL
jgi:hypothetical protein